MPFQPGQSGNPKGRPKQQVTRVKVLGLQSKGDVDSLDFLATVVGSEEFETPLRITAAIGLAPYQHARVTKRKISKPIDLPASTNVEQATAAIAKIAALAAAGELALDEANDLINHQKAFIESKVGSDLETQVTALKDTLQRLGDSGTPFGITVLEGLPPLPGTNIAMPVFARPALEHSANGGERDGSEPDLGPEGPAGS
jgi:hypothetical protein